MSAGEANEIAAVLAETRVPILVGAMHTFDPGWGAAVEAWGDLPSSSFAIQSSIVLPPNSRFEDFATEVIRRTDGELPPVLDQETQARLIHAGVMGLAIHDLPLVRALLPKYNDLGVLHARFLKPFGYHIVLTAGVSGWSWMRLMNATWRPAWTFEAVAPNQLLRAHQPLWGRTGPPRSAHRSTSTDNDHSRRRAAPSPDHMGVQPSRGLAPAAAIACQRRACAGHHQVRR
jgi:myo-inositol 2-dehydrogenase / D-chiro-inositol 1-dehydrogenase